ncbi:spaetzle domain-containing protein 6 isoform X2 [Rhodnius prolixus]
MEKATTSLCGDLNKGFIPMNPMNQNIQGMPYPFELITNKTLQFLSRILPVLQSDETIPKVTSLQVPDNYYYHVDNKKASNRVKRSESSSLQTTLNSLRDFILESANFVNLTNHAKKFCDNGGGMMCLVYKALQGESLADLNSNNHKSMMNTMESPGDLFDSSFSSLAMERKSDNAPATPCPASIEYATPVFARNYQGIWRYIVQIPYEGYFTQTVQITKCLNTKCYYLEGKCLSSPRWVSLLVAEIYYPNGMLNDKVAKESAKHMKNDENLQCDGYDTNGCYQVRLYYDWFLIPGSCKCWRPNYLHQFLKYR